MALSILAFFLFLGGRKSSLRSSLLAILCVLATAAFAGRTLAQSTPSAAKPIPDLSEGEKLLLEMESKLLDARSLRIRFALEAPSLLGLSAPRGVLEFAERDRCRFEGEVNVNGDALDKPGSGVIRIIGISDGKSISVRISGANVAGERMDENQVFTNELPKGFNQRTIRSFSRDGLLSVVSQIDAPSLPSSKKSQFKAVVREKLDGRDALKIEWHTERSVVVVPPSGGGCMFCRPGPVAPMSASPAKQMTVQDVSIVWLDASSKLPLKRVVPDGMVERYQSIEINPKLDASRFVQTASK